MRSFLESIADGVAHGVEPALAAVDVQPALGMPALGIGTEEQELGPLCVIELRRIAGPRDMRFAAAAELDLRARAAMRTPDQQHQCATAAAAASSMRRPV